MRLGLLLKIYREHHRLTLRELAADIGIDATSLHRAEQGEKSFDLQSWIIVTNWLAGKA